MSSLLDVLIFNFSPTSVARQQSCLGLSNKSVLELARFEASDRQWLLIAFSVQTKLSRKVKHWQQNTIFYQMLISTFLAFGNIVVCFKMDIVSIISYIACYVLRPKYFWSLLLNVSVKHCVISTFMEPRSSITLQNQQPLLVTNLLPPMMPLIVITTRVYC